MFPLWTWRRDIFLFECRNVGLMSSFWWALFEASWFETPFTISRWCWCIVEFEWCWCRMFLDEVASVVLPMSWTFLFFARNIFSSSLWHALLWFVITSEIFLVQFKGVTLSNTCDEMFLQNNQWRETVNHFRKKHHCRC